MTCEAQSFARDKTEEENSLDLDILMTVRDLTVGYEGAALLPPISFELCRNQVTSIVGHNGSGKSSLLRTLLDLQPKKSGLITTSGLRRIGYVPQREAIDPIYPIRVHTLVETGRYGIRGVGRRLQSEDLAFVHEAMKSTGVLRLKDRHFRTLSGGEQQRALLARALCTEPDMLVLDEPTASLDERGANEVMGLTVDLASKRRAAVLMVNHFIDLVARISNQVILLDRDHQKVAVGSPEEVLKSSGVTHGR